MTSVAVYQGSAHLLTNRKRGRCGFLSSKETEIYHKHSFMITAHRVRAIYSPCQLYRLRCSQRTVIIYIDIPVTCDGSELDSELVHQGELVDVVVFPLV